VLVYVRSGDGSRDLTVAGQRSRSKYAIALQHDMEPPKAVTDLVRTISCAYGIATDRSAASACGERTFRRAEKALP
jgi:hypothetical protein